MQCFNAVQCFHVLLQAAFSSVLFTIRNVFNLVTLLHPQPPGTAHSKQEYMGFLGGGKGRFHYLKKESFQFRTICDPTVKVPQGFAL